MRPIDIASLCEIKNSLPHEIYSELKGCYSILPKDAEVEDIAQLVRLLVENGASLGSLDNFVLGYKIPQIMKEFDLLRIGRNEIVNIEIKRQGDPAKLLQQLQRNR